jgi:hypothetical protein
LGNPDVLFIDLKSKFVFVSEENRMPLSHTKMSFILPLQILPKDEFKVNPLHEKVMKIVDPTF